MTEPAPEHDQPSSSDPPPEMAGASDTFGLTPRPRSKTRLVDPLIGADLGGVTILRLIGEGGMGRVYEARQARPERTVAVKVIRQGILSEKTMRRFEREAEFLARLQHPGIAQIYIVGTYESDLGEVPFYVMELIADAKPITSYVHDLNLPVEDRVRLFQRVCEAVAHGHDRGVVHRDLKPGNILIDAHGQPKVIDFGVARSTDSDLAITAMRTDTGQVVGTLQYMSPEQFGAEPDDLDARADVYSLGVVLYEMLAGEPPYQVRRKGIHEAAKVICEQPPVPLRSRDKTLPREIEAIASCCLQKNRTKRYLTAGTLVADLRRFLEGAPVVASGGNRLSRALVAIQSLPGFPLRRRALAGAVLPVMLLASAVAVLAVFATMRARPRPESAEQILHRVKRESQPAIDPAAHKPSPPADVVLPLTTEWRLSGIRVEAGACYRLTVSGEFTDDVGATVGPEGRPPAEDRDVLGPRHGLTRSQRQSGFVDDYPRFSVVAKVGNNKPVMPVGKTMTFIAPSTGELSFRLNDLRWAASSARGDARVQLVSVQNPSFVGPGGDTTVSARVCSEIRLVFEPEGLRRVRTTLLDQTTRQDFPVLINGIAWWPQGYDPMSSGVLLTGDFKWASGNLAVRPEVRMADGCSPLAKASMVEVAPGKYAVALQSMDAIHTDVTCTVGKPAP